MPRCLRGGSLLLTDGRATGILINVEDTRRVREVLYHFDLESTAQEASAVAAHGTRPLRREATIYGHYGCTTAADSYVIAGRIKDLNLYGFTLIAYIGGCTDKLLIIRDGKWSQVHLCRVGHASEGQNQCQNNQ